MCEKSVLDLILGNTHLDCEKRRRGRRDLGASPPGDIGAGDDVVEEHLAGRPSLMMGFCYFPVFFGIHFFCEFQNKLNVLVILRESNP